MKGIIAKNILDLIGNTPLVPLTRLNPNKNVKILVKLESFNPGGSIKDRIALNMIEAAEKRGELTKDKIVLEASSGNTGIGLALVCAVKGYRCLIAMSEGASLERRKIMKAYGAQILLTPASLGTDGAIEAVYKLYRKEPKRYFLTDQFNNDDNWKAHYNTTALEIWEQTAGKVDAIVATMGTTGTLMGISKRFKELSPKCQIIGVEPYYGHAIQGLKNMKESYKPGIFDKNLPSRIINCEDEEAFETARRLAREEGIFAGMSSGAAVAAALKVAQGMKSGVIVAILPDGGERYLSTSLFSIPDEVSEKKGDTFYFFDTGKKKLVPFEPLDQKEVRIYSCGPTACEFTDLGMARRALMADLLKRVINFMGYKVKHVMNITDIDDRTVNRAIDSGIDLKEMTKRYERAFFEDMEALRVIPADIYPRASDHINDMIETTKELISKGFAYERHGSVYFDISKLRDYGSFSKIDLSAIDIGRTVDLEEYEKDSPLDFTLFKRVTLKELKAGIGIETPWGTARPGWHIECAVMSRRYLGDFFDIHTSGKNLIFPHHENEIAISKALTGKDLAKYWFHSELVLVEGKKIHPRDKNILTLRRLFEQGFSGRQIRFYMLKTHYKKAINFQAKGLKEASKALSRIDAFLCDVKSCLFLRRDESVREKVKDDLKRLKMDFMKAILGDLNTSGAFGVIFSFIRKVNPDISQGKINAKEAKEILSYFEEMDKILGVLDVGSKDVTISEENLELLEERQKAREQGDFKRADEIRRLLLDKGLEVIDTTGGTRIRIKGCS